MGDTAATPSRLKDMQRLADELKAATAEQWQVHESQVEVVVRLTVYG